MVDLHRKLNMPSKSPKLSISDKSSPRNNSLPLLQPPSVTNDISAAAPPLCAAYEYYLRLPDLRKLWESRDFPNWSNEPILKPALQALEITFRFISTVLSDPRPYTNSSEWNRRLESIATKQIEIIAMLCEDEEQNPETRGTVPTAYLSSGDSKTRSYSEMSLLPRLATWYKSKDVAQRILLSVECQMMRCSYTLGLGEPNLAGKPSLRYDTVCEPNEVHALKTTPYDDRIENYENHAVHATHQIAESWIHVLRKLLERIGVSIEGRRLEKAAEDCYTVERIWKLLAEVEDIHLMMDPADFLKLKNQLSVKPSSHETVAFCMRSKELVKVTKMCRDLRHRVPEILEVEVDPKGGPRIQEAAMKLYVAEKMTGFDKVHLLQAMQAIEVSMKRFFYGYKQVLTVVIGSSEANGNRVGLSCDGGDSLTNIFLEPTYFPSLDAAKTFLGYFCAIVEPSAEANEEKTSTKIVEETKNSEVEPIEKAKEESVVTEVEPTETKKELAVAEVEPTGTVKDELAVTEVEKNKKEPEQQSTEPKKEEQPNTASIPEKSNDVVVVEEKTRELEFEAPILKDKNNDIAGPTETEKPEPVVTQVEPTETIKEELVVAEVEPTEAVKEEPAVTEIEESQKEPEQQSTEPKEEVQQNTSSIPEQSTETNSAIVVEEKTRELEFEDAILKETNTDNAGPTETEIQSPKKEEEEKPKEASESQEPIGDTVKVHPPKDSDIEAVKEAGISESEAIPVKKENIDPLYNGVEEKPREQLQIGEEVVETIKEVEPEKATEKSEEPIGDTIKNSIVKEESETSTTVNTEQVSLNDSANPGEPSSEVEEKIVVEDVKKVVGVTENATSIAEKVDVAAENIKKEPEAPDAVQVSSREAEIEIKKAAEQNEAKTATPEAVEADTKVDEISKAVSEAVRETLASKFEEKDEEEQTIQTGEDSSEKKQIEEPVKTEVEATKENDTTTAVSKDLPKETPAKPAQKQSNNLISKVKQSLVKAKKAITGKSPSSKNLNSDQKGDIKVK